MERLVIVLLSLLYVLFMAVLTVTCMASGEFAQIMVTISGILCGAAPLLLIFLWHLQLNASLVFCYFIFLFAAQYLGSILSWYSLLSWWDLGLHGLSGVLLAGTGLALWNAFGQKDAGVPWLLFWFLLSFTAMGGVLWEMYEFSIDQLFGLESQQGNTDTMTDLMADLAGGFLAAAWVSRPKGNA